MKTNPVKPREIGEIAIRCGDIDRMATFYDEIVGLDVMSGSPAEGFVFFKICEGYGGHTTILALFLPDVGRPELHPHSNTPPYAGAKSSLHHLALTIDWEERQHMKAWLKSKNIPYKSQLFDWIGWEGIFVTDPEGNTIEFVAADPNHPARNQ